MMYINNRLESAVLYHPNGVSITMMELCCNQFRLALFQMSEVNEKEGTACDVALKVDLMISGQGYS
jgi:hypothetical protein